MPVDAPQTKPSAFGDLSDQAAGLRRLFQRKRARVIAFCGGKEGGFLENLARALAEQGRRVAVLDGRSGIDAPQSFADLARRDYAFDPQQFENPVRISCRGCSEAARLSDLPPQAQSRLLDRLAAIQQASDFVLIDTEQALREALEQVRELIVVTTPREQDVLDAYRQVKTFQALHGHAGCRVYTIIESGADSRSGQRAAENLIATARRFLSLPLHHLGLAEPDDPSTFGSLATRLLSTSVPSLGDVAIEACIAHMLQTDSEFRAAPPALLLQ